MSEQSGAISVVVKSAETVLSPARSLNLPEGEVHVWKADLDLLFPSGNPLKGVLSEDERERAGRFKFENHRRRFSSCRGLLRLVLGKYMRIDPARVRFGYSEKGKPFVTPSAGVMFNVSHSENAALLVFTRRREVGVDIERIQSESDLQNIAKQYFSEVEQKSLARLPIHHWAESFFHCWTRKEAFLKATGDGLSLPLDQFDVSLDPRQPPQLLATRPDSSVSQRWSLWALDVGSKFAAALALEVAPRQNDRTLDSPRP